MYAGAPRGQGNAAVGYCFQRLIVNFHQVCRVFGNITGRGNHYCDRFACVHHFISGKYSRLDIKTKTAAWQACGHSGIGKPGLQVG